MSIHFRHSILPLSKRYARFLVFIPLLLSGLTHLTNPSGFPSIHTDEGHYLRRALIFLDDHTLQEPSYRYDHPYFGQIFLSALFWLIGYPESITENINIINAASTESLYLVPRVIMGILALVDTFLIYKISEYLYDRKIALIASLIFAVTPMTWFLNRILLDNLLLPFLLSSILFASIYARNNPHEYFAKVRHKKMITIMLAGICLGLAIFTKLPAITMIPAVGFLVLLNIRSSNGSKNTKTKISLICVIWIVSVIAVPLIWPIHAAYTNELEIWIKDLSWQVQRDRPLSGVLETVFRVDPVLFIIGIAGLAYSALKKDLFLITWFVTPLLFFYLIGYVATFHLVLFLPIFSIAAARLLFGLRYPTVNPKIQKISLVTRVGAVCLFGLASTLTLIYTVGNVNSLYFETLAFVTNQIIEKDGDMGSHQNNSVVTIVGNQRYFWIPKHVFDLDEHQYLSYFARSKPLNEKLIIILDRDMERFISQTSSNDTRKQELLNLINKTQTAAVFELSNVQEYLDMIDDERYPYTSMSLNNEGTRVEVRTN
jgi:4-amino-4-deoxy-L-arabinose transferase-like glycosyltransferase